MSQQAEEIKVLVQKFIADNHTEEILPLHLRNLLELIIDFADGNITPSSEESLRFAGLLQTNSSNPYTSSQIVFGIAHQPGAYTNFLDGSNTQISLTSSDLFAILYKPGGTTAWQKIAIPKPSTAAIGIGSYKLTLIEESGSPGTLKLVYDITALYQRALVDIDVEGMPVDSLASFTLEDVNVSGINCGRLTIDVSAGLGIGQRLRILHKPA